MWQLAEAKNKFSQVFTRAMRDGPQIITRRDETAVLLSKREYELLLAGGKPRMSLGEYLLSGPSLDGIEFPRDTSPGREVDLG